MVAATEDYEGRKQEWTAILEGELAKAGDIESETGVLKFREIEEAVFATFIHSQSVDQKALTRDLMVLLGPTRPDSRARGPSATGTSRGARCRRSCVAMPPPA
jgi:hypothetical protein